ncbi:MAG TPA: hypothetical protein VG652_08840 [Gaiellaceae bacterium]|nr:hypothetical protein [Gaiellaceae bacterium]
MRAELPAQAVNEIANRAQQLLLITFVVKTETENKPANCAFMRLTRSDGIFIISLRFDT